jgi:hypothetical protein
MHHLLDNPADQLACQLRAAVLGVDHEKAARLSAEYTAAVRDQWIQLSAEQRAVSPLPQQSIELLAWVREMALMQHAMAAGHLAMVEGAGRRLAARALYLQTAALESRR